MSSGRRHHRPTIALLLLLALAASDVARARPTPSFLNIDNAPAPAPEDGVPGAANATRDRAWLPYEICGIAGGYVLTVAVFGVCLLTFGRRRRRAAQTSPVTLAVEMMKPAAKPAGTGVDPSPISPVSPSRSWFRAFKRTPSQTSGSVRSGPQSPTSPGVTSVTSFDPSVLDTDKDHRQREMERLYAAVMEHDAKQSKVVFSEEEIQPADPVPTAGRRALAPINTSASPQRSQRVTPITPASPRSPMKAIYPPDSPAASRFAPSSQTHLPPGSPASPQKPTSPRNVLTRHSRTPSIGSASSKKTKRSLRNLRISAPLHTKYPGDPAGSDDEARTPLSPRFYAPGPPPEPPSAGSQQPRTPATPASTLGGVDRVDPADPAYEELDQPRPLPRPAPQRGLSNPTLSLSPHPDAPAARPSLRSASSSTSTLPLRAVAGDSSSAATKTTYVEPRTDALSAARGAPRTGGGLRTPATGVPATPYSPYMPFTPITPVTPHLVTKQERRIRKREEGRRVATMDELVEDDKDMWDSGY